MNMIVKQTWNNIRSSLVLSIATVVAIAMIVTLFNMLLGLFYGSKAAIATLNQHASITVYLKQPLDFYEVNKLIESLEVLPEVKPPVVYTSPEAAIDAVTETFSLNDEILRKYDISLPASLSITVKDPGNMPALKTTLESLKFSTKLSTLPSSQNNRDENVFSDVAKNLSDINNLTLNTLILVILIFFLVSSALIGHVLYMHFHSRRDELAAMIQLLLGAGHPAQTSILLESMFYGITGVLLAVPFSILFIAVAARENSSALFDIFPMANVVLFELMAATLISALVSATVMRQYKR